MALTGSRGYRLIAEVLRIAILRTITVKEREVVVNTTTDLADLFQKEHPQGFDRQRFYQNVGLIPMKESNNASIRTS